MAKTIIVQWLLGLIPVETAGYEMSYKDENNIRFKK